MICCLPKSVKLHLCFAKTTLIKSKLLFYIKKRLVGRFIKSIVCALETCPFVTENKKCCRLPFEYNNRRYEECTADVKEKAWNFHWRNPWCFAETDDRNRKYRCLRNGKVFDSSR